jgi:hypothetical protein
LIQRIAQIPPGDAADHLTDEDAVHIIVRSSTQQQQRR